MNESLEKLSRLLLIVMWICLSYGCSAATPTPAPIVSTVTALHQDTPVQASPTPTEDRYAEMRKRMVETQLRSRDITDEDVLRVMEKVPRHLFVSKGYKDQAYADHPLPIGYGQTISQPYIVALMTQILKLKRGDKILEVGTGSAYQAAILAELTEEVYTVEIVEELAKSAAEKLRELNYDNVHVKHADGYYGWEEHAPYDAIIVTCAPDHVPQSLVQQLADGGRMILPVGPPGGYQSLWLVEKHGEEVSTRNLLPVSFVPLTGEH